MKLVNEIPTSPLHDSENECKLYISISSFHIQYSIEIK